MDCLQTIIERAVAKGLGLGKGGEEARALASHSAPISFSTLCVELALPILSVHGSPNRHLTCFQIVYEGVSQGAVSFLVRALTDKKTRLLAAPEPLPLLHP